jgi:hypothetical protein
MTTVTMTKPAAKTKPTKEEVRQMVLADQAVARAEVAAARDAKAKPAKANGKTAKAKTKPTKAADTRKITVLAKANLHAAGSRRAGWFKLLKTGMSVEDAVAAGVREIYLQRMAAKGVIKIG